MKGRRARRASEALAAHLLEEMGFRVVRLHEPVVVGGFEVSDIDIVAEKDGQLYAVEVKAGAVDVSGLRQAYVNSILTGMRPLVVARGYAGEEARALADRLGVSVIVLPDLVAAGADEIREIVRESVVDALSETIQRLIDCPQLSDDEWRLIEAIAAEGGLPQAAQRLGMRLEEAARILAGARKRAGLTGGRRLVLEARLLTLCRALRHCRERGGPEGGTGPA